MKIACTLALAIALAAPGLAPAVAQTTTAAPVLIADLHRDVFRAVQYMRGKSTTAERWTADDIKVIRNAILKDGVLDASEAQLLDALRAGPFSLTLRARQEATFKPNDLVLQGSLAAPTAAALAIAPADLTAAVTQGADETRAAFLVRQRAAGTAELLTLIETDAVARTEARQLIADRFYAAWVQGIKSDLSLAKASLRNTANTELANADALPPAKQAANRAFIQEAAVLLAHQHAFSPEEFGHVFSNPATAKAEAAAIAAKLGLN